MKTLIILFTLVANVALGDGRGNEGPGAGSHESLLRYLGNSHPINLQTSITLQPHGQYVTSFKWTLFSGLKNLEKELKSGKIFKDRTGKIVSFTADDLKAAESFKYNFVISYGLGDHLINNRIQETALNDKKDNIIRFNPIQWEYIDAYFQPEIAKEIKQTIAVHEVLSLTGKERTNFYAISSELATKVKAILQQANNKNLYKKSIVEKQEAMITETARNFVYNRLKEIVADDTEIWEGDIFSNIDVRNAWDGPKPLDWEMVMRVLDVTCDKKTEWTSIDCFKRAMMQVVFNMVPITEREIQKLVTAYEGSLGLHCGVSNGTDIGYTLLDSGWEPTRGKIHSWNLKLICRNSTREKLIVKLGYEIVPGNLEKGNLTVTSETKVDNPIYFEPNW